MYFLKIFHLYIADQDALFYGLLPPPEVGGKLVFDHKMSDFLQGRLHSLLVQPDDIQHSFLWVTGNTLPRTYQAKMMHF